MRVLQQAAELSRNGEAFALATVVWRQGPSSGKQGSSAIITADGELHGWIGGACAEPTVVREARQAIEDGNPRLLLLGAPEQFGAAAMPEGMAMVPISCASEGALEVYIEPVRPAPRLMVVGSSPMTRTLSELAAVLDWNVDLVNVPDFTPAPGAFVIVATQGHGDEEAVERAIAARPAYLGLVASRKRGETVLGYLADRGVPAEDLERVRVPAGLDLGKTTHEEMAVAILADLIKFKSEYAERIVVPPQAKATVTDPVCGMTVESGESAPSFTHEGETYRFCCPGCRTAFSKSPESFLEATR